MRTPDLGFGDDRRFAASVGPAWLIGHNRLCNSMIDAIAQRARQRIETRAVIQRFLNPN
jgi:hypothetical protein